MGYNSRNSQSSTWENIRRMKEKKEKLLGKKIISTGDFIGDIVGEDKKLIEEYLQSFPCPQTATGLIAMINNSVVGVDTFADRHLFEKNYKAVLGGYITDAIDNQGVQELVKITPTDFLGSVMKAKTLRYPSIASGIDLRIESSKVIGCALVTNEIIHLEAFVNA